jgi:hypothetical protein
MVSLRVVVQPQGAAEIVFDPMPYGVDSFPRNSTVTITVSPQPGWRLKEWAGPAYKVVDHVAKVFTDNPYTVSVLLEPDGAYVPVSPTPGVVAQTRPTVVPVPTPTPTPTSAPTPAPAPTFRNYYSIPEVDPGWNQGVYLPRHCRFWGEYEGVSYDGIPVQKVPFKAEHKKEFYSEATLLDFVDYPGHGTQKPGGGNISCEADWEMLTHLSANLWKGEQAPRDLYGVSFYDRIFDFYPIWPTYQSGIWGQWIQSPNSHPYSAISSIEGGLGAYGKFGRSKYPKYMANSATHFYNPNSSLFGWGFYERRVDCCYYGGIQITNKVLSTPNSIAFDEDQKTYEKDGGVFFGHGWFALPIFDGKERGMAHEPTMDSGKLTWTFFIESAQYEGPMWGYVPEYWYRRIDRWNALEVLLHFWEARVEDKSISAQDLEVENMLIDYLGGRKDIDTVMDVIKSQDWYVDDVSEYDREKGDPFWVQAKNTFAFNAPHGVAIGAEMPSIPVFREYDQHGSLYIKIFSPNIPSLKEKEPFTLDGKTYDARLYKYFVDFFNGEGSIDELNTNFDRFSNPIQSDGLDDIHLGPGKLYASAEGERNNDDPEYKDSVAVHWNMPIEVNNVNGEISTYFDWSEVSEYDRNWSQYYRVEVADSLEDYKFIPVLESEVPENLQKLEPHDIQYTVSIMPHVITDEDKGRLDEIKSNTDNLFGVDSTPANYSCWECGSNPGCDPIIYESVLDDGSKVKYRWYKFRYQPTFQELMVDYPEIYTEKYLNDIQATIAEMHKSWGSNQDFLDTPSSVNNLHLVELDNGLIVDTPPGKEFGWVPIVLEVSMPYGKWQTDLDFLDTEHGSIDDY